MKIAQRTCLTQVTGTHGGPVPCPRSFLGAVPHNKVRGADYQRRDKRHPPPENHIPRHRTPTRIATLGGRVCKRAMPPPSACRTCARSWRRSHQLSRIWTYVWDPSRVIWSQETCNICGHSANRHSDMNAGIAHFGGRVCWQCKNSRGVNFIRRGPSYICRSLDCLS